MIILYIPIFFKDWGAKNTFFLKLETKYMCYARQYIAPFARCYFSALIRALYG